MLSENLALQLLKESIITPGFYNPSQEFLANDSIGIAFDGQPLLMVGYPDYEENHQIIDRLLGNKHFFDLVDYVFGSGASLKLSKMQFKNAEVCPGAEYASLTTSEQGQAEDGSGIGDLVAVLMTERKDFAAGLCMNSSIMLCFYPNAKPLSIQISL